MRMLEYLFLVCLATVAAQQVYISAQGPSARPFCTDPTCSRGTDGAASPHYYHTSFSYTQTETVRAATPARSSGPISTYGASYAEVSHLIPHLYTTSWGNWYPNAVSKPSDTPNPYGEAAYSQLWDKLDPVSFTRGMYSTTVSPTPLPTSDLVLPPPLYFGPTDCYNFPNDFILGVAGSASQIEGAVADEGRTPALPELLNFGGELTGATEYDYVTLENYYLYKQDIVRLSAMGVTHYSFSIPWSRILPFALPGTPVNSQALDHYTDLIDFAISRGMSPIVTLLHADTPLSVFGQNYTAALAERSYISYFNFGYGSPTFQDAFVNYGKVVIAHFADRVPIWITVNEPQTGAVSGPAVDNVLKSHARLVHFYREELNGTGKVSMKMGVTPGIPQDPRNASHVEAVQHYNDLMLGTFLYPLVLGKDYPDAFKMTIQDYVPLVTKDLAYLRGTMDFIALDAYSFAVYYPIVDIPTCAANNASINLLYPTCVGSTEITLTGWNIGYHADYYMWSTPTYLRTGLNYLWNTYRAPIMLTEFGFPTPPNSAVADLTMPDVLFDTPRSEYYLSYLSEVLKAIWEDGVHVMGALAWSWADNWEFGTFDYMFGLQAVNLTSQERMYKRSFFDLVDFVETRRMQA